MAATSAEREAATRNVREEVQLLRVTKALDLNSKIVITSFRTERERLEKALRRMEEVKARPKYVYFEGREKQYGNFAGSVGAMKVGKASVNRSKLTQTSFNNNALLRARFPLVFTGSFRLLLTENDRHPTKNKK